MPYKIVIDGNKHCVQKESGERMGCSDSHEQAVTHMRALYAAEGKKKKEGDGLLEYIAKAVESLLSMFDGDTTIEEDKAETKETSCNCADDKPGVMFWKEEATGEYKWIARYSNNRRDSDNPAEILSAESHMKFADKVEKGLVKKPVVMLYHVPEWTIGVTDHIVYDDSGFTVAFGRITKGYEDVAEFLSTLPAELVGVSHGMPPETVVYDPSDSTIVKEYESVEITFLPLSAAANKLADFIILERKEEMAIPETKKERLKTEWGISDTLLAKIEQSNAAMSKAADEAEIEKKEVTEVTEVAPIVETQKPEETHPEDVVVEATSPVLPEDQSPSRKEIAEALSSTLLPIIENLNTLSATVQGLKAQFESSNANEKERIDKALRDSTPASLKAMLTESLIGKEETRTDGRSSLAGDKPKQAAAVTNNSNSALPDFIQNIIK